MRFSIVLISLTDIIVSMVLKIRVVDSYKLVEKRQRDNQVYESEHYFAINDDVYQKYDDMLFAQVWVTNLYISRIFDSLWLFWELY